MLRKGGYMFGIEGAEKIFPLDEVKNDNAQNTTGDAQENKVISNNEEYKNEKNVFMNFQKHYQNMKKYTKITKNHLTI